MSNNLYCKLFVDTPDDVDIDGLRTEILAITGGALVRRSVTTAFGVLDIRYNEDFDRVKRVNESDGFLFFRYYVELEGVGSIKWKDFVEHTAVLLGQLRRKSYKVIPACDFEEQLENGAQ